MKSGNVNFLEPSGPLQACNGSALPQHYIYTFFCSVKSIQLHIRGYFWTMYAVPGFYTKTKGLCKNSESKFESFYPIFARQLQFQF